MKLKKIRSFRIITFGCRVNQAESRMIGEVIVKKFGCQMVNQYKKADLVVINTCCVTGKADREVRKEIRRVKRENPHCFLVVCGCFVERVLENLNKHALQKTDFCSESELALTTSANSIYSRLVKEKKVAYKGRRRLAQTSTFTHKNRFFQRISSLNKNNDFYFLVDMWLGNKDKMRIVEILKEQFNNETIKQYSNIAIYKDKYAKDKRALIKIQEGCNNFCSYCIVPYVRGRSKSRTIDEIIREIKEKVDEGIEEIVLTGIDISSYEFRIMNLPARNATHNVAGGELRMKIKNLELERYNNHLVKLVLAILLMTKVKKISFGSIGLKVFNEEFVELYSKNKLGSTAAKFFSSGKILEKNQSSHTVKGEILSTKKKNLDPSPRLFSYNITMKQYYNRLSSYFHIPLQSGCDQTLKRMNRKYCVSDFVRIISDLQKKIPDFTFSTDIIVGFPGETNRELEETLRTVKELKKILGKSFIKAHIFRFSARDNTYAGKMMGQSGWEKVAEKDKKARSKAVEIALTGEVKNSFWGLKRKGN